MSHIVWAGAIFRILAVWILTDILIGVPNALANALQWSDFGPPVPVSAYLIPSLVVWSTSAAVVAGLWFRSDRLAELVWRDRPAPAVSAGIDPATVQQAVLVGLGVYLVVYGLPHLTELAGAYYAKPEGLALEANYAGNLWARAIGVAIQIAAGVLLMVRSGALVAWLTRPPRQDESTED